MSERFDNPQFYSHVFYPKSKSIWKIVVPIVLSVPLAIGAIFLNNYLNPQYALSSKLILVVVALVAVTTLPVFILLLMQRNKMQLGIGPGGVYIRGYGLLTWNEIKSFELWQHMRYGKSIKITMVSPEDRGEDIPLTESVKRSAREMFGGSLDEKFIGGNFMSIPLEELIVLLREYHTKYKQEADSVRSVFAQTQSPIIHVPVNKGPAWMIRLGIAVLFCVGLAIFSFIRNGIVGTLVVIGFGSLVALFMFFKKTHLFFQIILLVMAIVLVVFGLGTVVYELVVNKKLQTDALFGVGVVLCLLVVPLFARRRMNKKLQENNHHHKDI